jgi:hypothetical protein
MNQMDLESLGLQGLHCFRQAAPVVEIGQQEDERPAFQLRERVRERLGEVASSLRLDPLDLVEQLEDPPLAAEELPVDVDLVGEGVDAHRIEVDQSDVGDGRSDPPDVQTLVGIAPVHAL